MGNLSGRRGSGARGTQAVAGAWLMVVAGGCGSATAPGAVARGNEPFWAVEVADSGIVYKTPENLAGVVYRNVAYEVKDGVRTWRATSDGKGIVLVLEPTRCTDSMSGKESPWTARVEVEGVHLEGCGDAGHA